jgi:nitrile hydratase accessory protein
MSSMVSERARARAASLEGSVAPPTGGGGEPYFAEPWEARAFALAVETVERLGLPWDAFRAQLISAIGRDPYRAYYQSWLEALERLVLAAHAVEAHDLDVHRMRAAAYRVDEPGTGDVEIFPIDATEARLRWILEALFVNWWRQIRFGPIIQGAVYELRAPRAAALSELDGYLTIGFDGWHIHLCIGEHRGEPSAPVDPVLARRRRCAHAELARIWVAGAPTSWMFRMYNGDGDQQLTVLLPNPFLDDDQRPLGAAEWDRLECWDELRLEVLGLQPDALDRLGSVFRHP